MKATRTDQRLNKSLNPRSSGFVATGSVLQTEPFNVGYVIQLFYFYIIFKRRKVKKDAFGFLGALGTATVWQ